MRINKRNFVDYFVLSLYVAISGIPAFHSKIISILEFSILFFLFIGRKKLFNSTFIWFFVLLLIMTLFQALKFQFFSIITSAGFFIMVFSAYLIVKILEEKFILYYINIMYVIAISSLVFFVIFTIIPSLTSFFVHTITPIFSSLNSIYDTFILYNITYKEGYLKNSGPFWEPGAFAGYLIVAYIFNFFTSAEKITKKNIVLLVTIFTTLSTTAYLTLFVFYTFIYYKKIKNIALKVAGTTLIIASGIYAYNSLDFLGEKIEHQLKIAQTADLQQGDETQRFITILRDMQDLKGHEIVGRGGNDFTRYDLSPTDKLIIRTVGLTDILVRVGIVVYIIMFYFIYKSICFYLEWMNEKKIMYCVGIFVAILFTLMSEVYFNFQFYWSLLFMQFVYRNHKSQQV